MSKQRVARRSVVVGSACTVVGAVLSTGCTGDDTDPAGGTGSSDTGGDSDGTSVAGSDTTGLVDASSTGAGADGSSTDGSAESSSGAGAESSESGDTDGSSTGAASCEMGGWLAGGTASMSGDYDDPFVEQPEACVIVGAQGCGPCWVAGPDRVDITNAEPGLPMQFWIRVLYEQGCEPVAAAVVDVWFADIDGVYSGQTPSPICSNGDDSALAENFMRGQQTTDAEGKLHFDAIFPGWYPGRTTHIHALVIIEGVSHYVTQLYFDDALAEGIYMEHPDYDHRPNRDTNNAQDGGFDPGSPNTIATAKTEDCALLAWATILVPGTPQAVGC